jgi:hypothetical protein
MAYKVLAIGTQSSGTATTIYTVPSNATAAIYSFVLTNTTSSNITVDVSINDTATTRVVKQVIIPSGSGRAVTVPEMLGAYSARYEIVLDPTSGNAFNYLVTGDEV